MQNTTAEGTTTEALET